MMLSMVRLMAVAHLGRTPDAVGQRISTLIGIDADLDLFE